MNFQILPLAASQFAHLFNMTDTELASHGAYRQVVTKKPGTPCRVSLADAEIGETVLLLNYAHQPEPSPYRATHAIFVRQHAKQADLAVNEVPEVLRSRLLSVRLYNRNHMMIDAEVVSGEAVSTMISAAFYNPDVAYIHLHNAKPGCFAALVRRAD